MEGWLPAALVGFVIAVATTPVGVSGAFLLVPWQTQVLGRTDVGVSSTSLVFNLVVTPVAVLRLRAAGRIDAQLVRRVLLGSAPGVVIGALLRVYGLTAPRAFLLLASGVLLLVALRLARYTPLQRVADSHPESDPAGDLSRPGRITAWGFATAVIGGAYGVGGGSLLAPILVAMGIPVRRVAGATLLSTGVTSAVGLIAYLTAAAAGEPSAPDWRLGVALGAGGALGAVAGVWLQPRIAERHLRHGLVALTGVAAAATFARAW
jgi:uncharacterized membrane protein YfcA